MATIVSDLLYSVFSPPGTRSYSVTEYVYRAVALPPLLSSHLTSPCYSSSYVRHSLDKMQDGHADTLHRLHTSLSKYSRFKTFKIRSDLEGTCSLTRSLSLSHSTGTKHLAYQLCATAQGLTKRYGDSELGSLKTFFEVNEAFTRKLKVHQPVSFQDQKEGCPPSSLP